MLRRSRATTRRYDSGDATRTVNPATGLQFAVVADSSVDDVDRQVQAATQASKE
jgi:acyl-CoA reductase-like NAD-dependent aldehyde dehydrogenase